MENTNNLESGFKINNIILLESVFSRINNMEFGEGMSNDFKIDLHVGVKENIITVVEEAIVMQKYQEKEQFNIRVKMIGVFESIGESSITDFDEFGRINGAAIIFPYIREHITNLTVKAGIGPIILPPVNFTKIEKTKQ